MMMMNNGEYKTAAGSTMSISGEHGGRSVVEFDWWDEGACPNCEPEPYADDDGFLVWNCDDCGGGRAELFAV